MTLSHLSLSQASTQRVAGVRFVVQTLQLSLQTLFGLTDVSAAVRGFCARLHRLPGQRSNTCRAH